MTYDVVVAGGGPAGVTSAIYTARAGLSTKVFDPMGGGGQAGTTDKLYNYPGFPQGVSGPELMDAMIEQAKVFGADIEYGEAISVEKDGNLFFIESDNSVVRSKALIWAAGTTPRTLNVPGEKQFTGRGVSFCATCDGPLFRDKVVAVVGGGDSALTEAGFLTKFAREVILIHRRAQFRAGLASINRVTKNPNIKIRYSSTVEKMEGSEKLESLTVRNVSSGQEESIAVDGVFLYVGSSPNSAPVKHLVNLNKSGYILTDEAMVTATPGLFAVGDVREKSLRQVATAVGDGATASWALERYLTEQRD